MYEPKLKKEIRCPLEYGLDIFGGKWKPRIICVLAEKMSALQRNPPRNDEHYRYRSRCNTQRTAGRRYPRSQTVQRNPPACRIFIDQQRGVRHPHSEKHLPVVRCLSSKRQRTCSVAMPEMRLHIPVRTNRKKHPAAISPDHYSKPENG